MTTRMQGWLRNGWLGVHSWPWGLPGLHLKSWAGSPPWNFWLSSPRPLHAGTRGQALLPNCSIPVVISRGHMAGPQNFLFNE